VSPQDAGNRNASAPDVREEFLAWWCQGADTLGLVGLDGHTEPVAREYAFAAWTAARAALAAPVSKAKVRDGFYYGVRDGNSGAVWYADHGDGKFVKEHPEPHAEAARLNVEKYAAPVSPPAPTDANARAAAEDALHALRRAHDADTKFAHWSSRWCDAYDGIEKIVRRAIPPPAPRGFPLGRAMAEIHAAKMRGETEAPAPRGEAVESASETLDKMDRAIAASRARPLPAAPAHDAVREAREAFYRAARKMRELNDAFVDKGLCDVNGVSPNQEQYDAASVAEKEQSAAWAALLAAERAAKGGV
jgi:hypothetical protein